MNSKIMFTKFIERSFHEKEFKKDSEASSKIDRDKLLRAWIQENKYPQTILVRIWRYKFYTVLSIVKNNFYLTSNDSKLSKIFKQKATITQRKKTHCFWLPFYKTRSTVSFQGHVGSWLATCARKPKVPGSNRATSHVERWALCSNRLGNKCLWSEWKL